MPRRLTTVLFALLCSPLLPGCKGEKGDPGSTLGVTVDHVLLISVDGFHQRDLEVCAAKANGTSGACPNLAALQKVGVTYTKASTAKPSDSFPGLLALVTGGTPRSTGVYYDDVFARDLYPPKDVSNIGTPSDGGNCAILGTEVLFDETADVDLTVLDGGNGLNPNVFPQRKDEWGNCVPVYPHDFVRVNTIFQVAKGAGLRTAWSDKHRSYDLVNGPSAYGRGVDDLYTPEVASLPPGQISGDWTASATLAAQYDDKKVTAILNQIDGKDSAGTAGAGVPAIFGMNFQAVSVGQKTLATGSTQGGYLDAAGTANVDLATAISHTDASIGSFVTELKAKGLWVSTVIIVTAKHGQSPIDPTRSNKVGHVVGTVLTSAAQITEDDVSLVWLSSTYTQADAAAAAAALVAATPATTFAQTIYYPALPTQAPAAGTADLTALFGDPAFDPRVPDVVVQPIPGTIYTKASKPKQAEHGGFAEEDTHVALLVASGAPILPATVTSAVETRQVAPTILKALGLDPALLQAVQQEFTVELPELPF